MDGRKPQRAIFLMGPTAVGKTRIAVELVQRLPLEIVSVDSAMVYRGMDIGTGKPGPEVLARAPHRLVDIREPEEPYSAGQFGLDAQREMADILALGKIPLLVGGTGLYFRALREGLSPLPPADRAVRQRLNAEASRYGWERLHARLAAVDPPSAARIHPNDPQRIQRALEVFELSGRPLSEHHARRRSAPGLAGCVYAVALAPAHRNGLYRRIRRRFADMLARGLVDEVRALRGRPAVHAELPAMRAVGYRQVWEYLEGLTDRQTMERRAVSATHHLAKRQLTWLRGEPVARWVSSDDPEVLDKLLNALDNWISASGPH
ncbi:MAG: tRNA (adenosine(37)-N6)-dimethylallyltransferase MiaA [Gammaproteobacteria bacterium]|nr:tRNA (adenosine(37)-N6)-dimethylallyltransferase MiaA [Gammaproteobacteria bacterium]NIR84288.1 tRNA (adenosine(37)-N6)-dimethylallyltransferase MiaA [Gammaproteobacteria bacterium]NIR89758.1 tRNA (adenosine(37)-N6)-dimethylallyltransferase MiaA [Gammaproteobacteria bacterium]NIU05446.1 tRNA (adenosine(37)-N6)-dimethylallyltransferase MiaA [Gammaproteobacteria bacterium]NIV52393.1 tRNA (adenosine(37)-N6)-dimethylallyltransferase MiaA [Gammaproteobacteria bacterium]